MIEEQYQKFISENKIKSKVVNGRTVSYYELGNGIETILFLSELNGFADSWFQIIEPLKSHYRIIAIEYPETPKINELVSIIDKLILDLKIGKVTLVGESLGGMIAQLYIQEHPDTVDKVILLSTIIPNKIFGIVLLCLKWSIIDILPFNLGLNVYIASLAWSINLPQKEKDFWMNYFSIKIHETRNRSYIDKLFSSCIDYCLSYKFANNYVQSWKGKGVLLIAKNDLTFRPFIKKPTIQFYQKRNFMLKFLDCGHYIHINKPDETVKAIEEMLEFH